MVYEKRIESLGELITCTKEICGKWPHRDMWFRGQEDASWDLTPAVHRSYSGNQEHDMIAEFILEAPLRYAACPGPSDYSRWLALMQHYGLPTRLLDWTKSPLVAAYFALAHEGHKDSAVWGLFPVRLNEVVSGHQGYLQLGAPQVAAFFGRAFGHAEDSPTGALAVQAETIDTRILVQQSVFTIHGDNTPLQTLYADEEILVKFILSAEKLDMMFIEIEKAGMSRKFLFPDLQNLSLSLSSSPRTLGEKS
ncbi:MAG: FRG domain-containing protein [Sedimentisphaerales bacterium]